jgi:hypothetical protein
VAAPKLSELSTAVQIYADWTRAQTLFQVCLKEHTNFLKRAY